MVAAYELKAHQQYEIKIPVPTSYAPAQNPSRTVRRLGSLALPNNFFLEQPEIDDAGLKATPWPLRRSKLCDKLREIADRFGLLLVRGPFASGKTALAQLLDYHLRDEHETFIITAAGCGVPWPQYWKQQTQVDWDTVIDSDHRVYVIIDEVQTSYPTTSSAHTLWGSVKRVIDEKKHQIRFIFLGSYGDPQPGESTPIRIPPEAIVSLHQHNGTPGLAYSEDEYFQLCAAFQGYSGIPVDDRTANYLFHISGGHPGICGFTFGRVYQQYKNYISGGIAKDEVYMFVHSAGLHAALHNASTRGVPDFNKHPRNVNEVLKRVLSEDSFSVAYNDFSQDQRQLVEDCLKVSLLIREGDKVMFSSPVVQCRALSYYFSETKVKPANLGELIVAAVQRFSTRQLRTTKSKDTKSKIMEGQWQQEFFRATAALLPESATLSPEYGREPGAQGQVDFFIAEYQWMIEILREGIDMKKHERRFEVGGQYEPLLHSVKEWAIVDFRGSQKKVKRAPQNNTYHVSFNDEFTKFMVRDPAGQEREYPLLGDKVEITIFTIHLLM